MGVKVLVADDAPFIREVLQQILTENGFQVVGEAEDGKSAIRLAQETDPDLILMDLVMPHMSGIEATKEILKIRPHQKIIACSTMDQESLMMAAIDAGCMHYVVKPFKKEELIGILKKAGGKAP
ncbi:MAG TPA: hypothetical protein DCL41_04450 [Bdellovibrionales bacterium]|nr:hypothetical protein [Pseudobdellovibrionaceae bacterium]HAG91095.1 hypothetical protein [Bdellovibrionales bacterium]|tara:strand:+ start:2960 stop:3331 length:372 start_codon:yes stop_codon:yes gene_type:complete